MRDCSLCAILPLIWLFGVLIIVAGRPTNSDNFNLNNKFNTIHTNSHYNINSKLNNDMNNNNNNNINTNNTSIFNVKDFGAVGDGSTDDTNAVMVAVKNLLVNGGSLYFPTGQYAITSTLTIPTSRSLQVIGDGSSSVILWKFDGHLFYVYNPNQGVQIVGLTFRDFAVFSTAMEKTITNAAIVCMTCVQSYWQNLLFNGDQNFPSGILMQGIADTNTVRDCYFWNIQGTGVEIGRGSEIRILGGRIIGTGVKIDNSIGVHITGNNGGVHIDSTDLIALNTAVLTDDSNGAGSNREIFITHATLDSCWRGLAVRDSSYISIAGCWAASSSQENIWVDVGLSPQLVIAGGTIFNAGAEGCSDANTACNGITLNSGTIIISGVEIRNNIGRGVWVPNGNVGDVVITGCKVFGNGIGFDITTTSDFMITNNICKNNNQRNIIDVSASSVVASNIGC